MYGPAFGSMFTGSMYGSGAPVFAVWLYAIACSDKTGTLDMNPSMLAPMIGCSAKEVVDALEYLTSEDPDSRSMREDGRRLVREGQFQYRMVNKADYMALKSYEVKREYDRRYTADKRSTQGTVVDSRKQSLPVVDSSKESSTIVHVDEDVDVDVDVDVLEREREPTTTTSTRSKTRARTRPREWVKPTAEEVSAYLHERAETRFTGEEFVDANEAKGWLVGTTKTPMKDWKAALRTWILNRNKQGEAQKGPPPAAVVADAYELEETMKHILKHSNALLILKGLTSDEWVIIRPAALRLADLADSDMPKGLMEKEFYKIHDQMMTDLYNSLEDEDKIQMEAHCPHQVKFETWARKTLQTRFSIPDPMEYEFSPQDVPA